MGTTESVPLKATGGYSSVIGKRLKAPVIKIGRDVTISGNIFHIKSLLGEGQYGKVYAGVEEGKKTPLAIKVMHLSDTEYATDTEISIYEALKSMCNTPRDKRLFPCIHMYEKFKNGSAIIVTDMIGGKETKKAFSKGGRPSLSNSDFINFLRLFSIPIAEMHKMGITHGDIKPENMHSFFDRSTGKPIRVVALDFGLSCSSVSRRRNPHLCQTQFDKNILPTYMDPQYIEGTSNLYSSDIYSLGKAFQYLTKMQSGYLNKSTKMKLRSLIYSMTNSDPQSRPTIKMVIASLERFLLKKGARFTLSSGVYEIVRKIGSGTYAEVYEVIDTQTGVHLAMKIQTNNGINKRVSQRELRVLLQIPKEQCKQKRVACILDYEEDIERGETVMIFDLFANGDLSEFSKSHKNMSQKIILKIMMGMILSLQTLHDLGVFHLDVKANNFVVGNDGKVALIDFGLSCSEKLQRTEPQMCTLRYKVKINSAPRHVAPEMLEGNGGQDLYAVDMFGLGWAFRTFLISQKAAMPPNKNAFSKKVWSVVKSMRRFDPLDRATLLEVIARIDQISPLLTASSAAPTKSASKSLSV